MIQKLLSLNLTNTLFGIMMIWMTSVSLQANIENCSSIYEVTATQLNIRSQPKKPSKILGTVKKGDRVCVDNFNGKWAKTEQGWISGKYLQETVFPIKQQVNLSNENHINAASRNNSGDIGSLLAILAVIIILSIIFFALKTLFYHTLISFGMAEPDGRSKNGIRLTRLGKFVSSISGILILFLFLLIGSLSK